MAKPEQSRRSRALLVALDPSGDSLNLLETAVALAGQLDADLEALFLEDVDLLRIADLPWSFEVTLSSAEERKTSSQAIGRALEARAADARSRLQNAAAQTRIRWSFRTVRGRRMQTVFAEASASDLLLIGHTRRGTSDTRLQQAARPRHAVYAAYEGSDSAQRALSVARELAERDGADLTVVLPETASPEESSRLAHAASETLSGTSVPVRFRRCRSDDACLLAEVLASVWAEAVVLAVDSPVVHDEKSFQSFLSRLPCPVILVR